MTIDTLGAFATTPEFFSGLVTGALVARTVQKTMSHVLERKLEELE